MRTLLLLGLVACAGAKGGSGGGGDGDDGEATFRVFYPDAPYKATVGKKFYVKPVGKCTYANGRDARWSMTGAKIDGGELPPGFTIEEGAISGTPKDTGSWTVHVKFAGVTCANKAHDAQVVDVTIAVAGATKK